MYPEASTHDGYVNPRNSAVKAFTQGPPTKITFAPAVVASEADITVGAVATSPNVVVDVVSVDEPRTFEKFGRSGKVASAKAKDASGEITMSLWNEQVDLVKPGMKVHIINGWCSEFKGEKQLSTGKFGRLEIVDGEGQSSSVEE